MTMTNKVLSNDWSLQNKGQGATVTCLSANLWDHLEFQTQYGIASQG